MPTAKTSLLMLGTLGILSFLVIGIWFSLKSSEQPMLQTKTPPIESASPDPVIVVSPNGGERLQKGSKYIIKWRGNFKERVKIFLISKKCVQQQCFKDDPIITQWPDVMVISQNAPNTGSYSWTVSDLNTDTSPVTIIGDGLGYRESIDPHEKIAPLGEYEIIVMRNWEARSGRIFDQSNALFSIIP